MNMISQKRLHLANYDLVQEDCVSHLESMHADSVDIVVTSPPYNLGISYGQYTDNQSRSTYLKWSETWIKAVKRVLKEDGSFFLNVGASPSNPLLPHQIAMLGADLFFIQNTFHWIKSISLEAKSGEQLSVGHFKPINSNRFVTDCHEYVFHLTKTGKVPLNRLAVGVPYQDKTNISRWGHTNGNDCRCRGNTWFVPYKTINSREKERPHPATFPVELAEWCIKLHGVNDTTFVLDPFVGIGHAAVAAERCSVKKFTGIDIDSQYIEAARELLLR